MIAGRTLRCGQCGVVVRSDQELIVVRLNLFTPANKPRSNNRFVQLHYVCSMRCGKETAREVESMSDVEIRTLFSLPRSTVFKANVCRVSVWNTFETFAERKRRVEQGSSPTPVVKVSRYVTRKIVRS